MERRRSIWIQILDAILIVVTLVAAISLFFALIARWVSPETTTFFAFFALAAPILYFANFLLFVMWLARWRRWFVLEAVVLLFSIWNVGDFVQMKWLKDYDHKMPSSQISVMTYNVHNFRYFNQNNLSSIAQIGQQIQSIKPDVVFLQEYQIWDSTELALFDSKMGAYPYRAYQHNVDTHFNHFGQLILSRFPLSTPRTISFEGSDNSVLVTDLYCPRDTIRLFGCHLQTTSFNAINKERGLRSMIESQKSDSLTRTAVAALSKNFKLRAAQADTLRQWIDNSLYPVIVAGDFNSPPLTYTYHTVRGNLADAFCEQGAGYGYTYKPMKRTFRIDYVLFDDQKYRAISYQSPDFPYSDHNPVVVKLLKK